MSRKVFLATAIVLLIAGLVPMGVSAQSATNQTWSTSITYYTPSDSAGTLQIRYYAEGSATSIDADPITLSPHKAGSLYIGAVGGIPDPFQGGAVLEATVPVVATAVNIAGDANNYPRPLYSGFDPTQADDQFYIPTVLYQQFGQTSLLSIQNVETTDTQATLKVYALGSTTPAFQQTYTIKGQSVQLLPTADMGLAPGFTGSAVVTTTGGRVVAVAQETDDAARGAKAFEGRASGAATIYMATMLCKAFTNVQTSFYAIQNVDQTATANVAIDFYNTTGSKVYTATGVSIGPFNKASVNPCMWEAQAPALTGINGSAVIRSTNNVPLIAIGKVSSAAKDMTPTAFVGDPSGATSIAAPYIRWKANPTAGWRANVAVMNVGASSATNVVVRYYDGNGTLAATDTLATGSEPLGRFIKANTNPELAGALDGNGDFGVTPFGGAIEVTSDQPVVVVVRVAKQGSWDGGAVTRFAEDYNGVSIP